VIGHSARFLLKSLFVTAAVCAAAALPVRAYWGEDGLAALALAGGVALLGALLARLPRSWIRGDDPAAPVHRAMATVGARLIGTTALALAVVLLRVVPRVPFGASLVVLYLVLMTIEMRDAIAEVNRGPASVAPSPVGPEGGR
jgi:hypothetical protein